MVANNRRTATVITRVDRLSEETLVGMTIAEVRAEFGDVLNILADTTPMINNEPVDEDYVLEAGDKVIFSTATGEKG